VKKTIYAISVVLLLGALIIQSVWGAQAKPVTRTHFAEGRVLDKVLARR
jgi:hypothetical protein